jgi:hypothetical protein
MAPGTTAGINAGFFESHTDLVASFTPALDLDIRMRKEYNVTPFEFSPTYYHEEYVKSIIDHRLKNIENASLRPSQILPLT